MEFTSESFWSVYKKHIFCQQFLIVLRIHTVNLGPAWGHLWVTLGLLWICEGGLGHLGATFLSFWPKWATDAIQFAKNSHFTKNFNDFTPLGVRTNGRFWGHSGLTLRPLLGNFVQLGANLSIWSLLRNHFDPFTKNIFCRQILKNICNHTVNLGPLWGHLWVTLGLLWVYEGCFGSPWGHFFVILAEVSNRRYSICKKLTFYKEF